MENVSEFSDSSSVDAFEEPSLVTVLPVSIGIQPYRPVPSPPSEPRFYQIDAKCNVREVLGQAKTETADLLEHRTHDIENYRAQQQRRMARTAFFETLSEPRSNSTEKSQSPQKGFSTARSISPSSGRIVSKPATSASSREFGNRFDKEQFQVHFSSNASIRQIKSSPRLTTEPKVDLSRPREIRPASPLLAQFKRTVMVYSPRYSGIKGDLWADLRE